MPRPKTASACRRKGTPAAYPSLKFAARPSRRRSGTRGSSSGLGAALAARATSSVWPPGRARPAGERRGGQRVEVGRRARPASIGSSCLAAFTSRSGASPAPVRDECELCPQQVDAGLAQTAERSALATASRSCAESNAPPEIFVFAAASAVRPAGDRSGSASLRVEERGRRGQPAARLRAARPSAPAPRQRLRSGSGAAWSVPGAAIRIQLRIGAPLPAPGVRPADPGRDADRQGHRTHHGRRNCTRTSNWARPPSTAGAACSAPTRS